MTYHFALLGWPKRKKEIWMVPNVCRWIVIQDTVMEAASIWLTSEHLWPVQGMCSSSAVQGNSVSAPHRVPTHPCSDQHKAAYSIIPCTWQEGQA